MRFLIGLISVMTATLLHAEIPALLDEAWTKYVADIDHWAYTETTRAFDAKGQQTRETITRYDPSLPYPEQFTILKHSGKKPIEQMQKLARQRGESRGKSLERPDGVENDAKPRINLNGTPALADLEHATVVEENDQSVIYAIPLHAENGKNSMVEKFKTLVRVSKTECAFEHVGIQLASPMRIKLIAKIQALDFGIDFTTVDPKFSPTATVFKDHSSASVLFRKHEGGHESVRSDFKRVTPYRDRFGVKVGPLRTIDF